MGDCYIAMNNIGFVIPAFISMGRGTGVGCGDGSGTLGGPEGCVLGTVQSSWATNALNDSSHALASAVDQSLGIAASVMRENNPTR